MYTMEYGVLFIVNLTKPIYNSNDQQDTVCELSARPAVSTLSVLARGLMRMRKRYITCVRPRELVRVVSVEEVVW